MAETPVRCFAAKPSRVRSSALALFGLPDGIACHNLDSLKACLAAGLQPDFCLKTFHHHKYPSCPTPEELADDKCDFYRTHRCQERPHGIWCINPEETAEDAEITRAALVTAKDRHRPWRA